MALKLRLAKLEKKVGRGHQPIIVYRYGEKSEAQAIEDWEIDNGPVGKREPMLIVLRYISPSEDAAAER
jgi:hypothetical protein